MQTGFIKEHSPQLAFCMRIIDLIILSGSSLSCFYLLFPGVEFNGDFLAAVWTAALLSLIIYPIFSVYRVWRGATLREELRAIFLAWSSLFLALIVLGVLTKSSEQYSRYWLGIWYTSGYLVLIVSRIILRSALGYIRSLGLNQRQIVIAGAGVFGQQVARKIIASPWAGMEIRGFFSLTDGYKIADDLSNIPVLGTINEIADYLKQQAIDQVWIAISLDRAHQIKQLTNDLAQSHCDIRYVPDISDFQLLNHSLTEIAGLPVMNLSVSPMAGIHRYIKAIEDRGLALLILLLISPLMLLLAIGVKLSSPGPVFYRQERMSWNGQSFQILKFRSMPVDTDKDSLTWGGADNKTPSAFGRWIRRTSLDELPQFINVLSGEMSIVGPRPERTIFVEQLRHQIPRYMLKHKMKAGITGWAQVNGWRGDTDLKQRIEHDLYYIENWSLGLDFKIILMTLFKGFTHKNAR